jgi:nucleoside-triphosphatase THEP1
LVFQVVYGNKSGYDMQEKCIILTGERGIGKSTICLKVSGLLAKNGYPHAGIVSLAIVDDSCRRVGFAAHDIRTGERWLLARKKGVQLPAGLPGSGFEGDAGVSTYGPFLFSNRGFEKATERVLSSVEEGCRLIILDEIGPLEIDIHRGFWKLYCRFLIFKNLHLLLVVRPELVETVRSFFKSRIILEYTAETGTRDVLPAGIVRVIQSGENN